MSDSEYDDDLEKAVAYRDWVTKGPDSATKFGRMIFKEAFYFAFLSAAPLAIALAYVHYFQDAYLRLFIVVVATALSYGCLRITRWYYIKKGGEIYSWTR